MVLFPLIILFSIFLKLFLASMLNRKVMLEMKIFGVIIQDDKGQKTAGVGVIIQDDEGRLVAAMSKKIKAPLGAVEAEAMAYEAGLMLAKEIGIQDFIIEGDSLVIHQALCEASTPPSSVAAVVQGMQELCRKFQDRVIDLPTY